MNDKETPARSQSSEPGALTALKQWESDTEQPARASEGNAFIDGYNAAASELARLQAERDGLREKFKTALECIRDGSNLSKNVMLRIAKDALAALPGDLPKGNERATL